MAIYMVDPSKEKALFNKMFSLGIREDDIIEKFIRSQGPGGQNVNKTSSCVYLKHIPTGIEVKCQKERSQNINRFLARRLLVDKIEEKILGEESAKRRLIEKIRRQKRKRSKKAKLKILKEKKEHAEKKILRKKINFSNFDSD